MANAEADLKDVEARLLAISAGGAPRTKDTEGTRGTKDTKYTEEDTKADEGSGSEGTGGGDGEEKQDSKAQLQMIDCRPRVDASAWHSETRSGEHAARSTQQLVGLGL